MGGDLLAAWRFEQSTSAAAGRAAAALRPLAAIDREVLERGCGEEVE